jgi:NTP pyrophosphatase (non-canonical NTP hydrolase)
VKDLCFTTEPSIFLELRKENDRQVNKWGIQNRSPFEWLAFTTEELGELACAISENYYRGGNAGDVVKEAIQTATLALKIAEMYRASKEGGEAHDND